MWVRKNDAGDIVSVNRWPTEGDVEEKMEEEHADIVAFRNRKKPGSMIPDILMALTGTPSEQASAKQRLKSRME